MLAVFADGVGKQAVAVLFVAEVVRWREGPILSVGSKAVGRRTHAASVYIELPVRPEVGAAAIRSERQIVIQTDGQLLLFGVCLNVGQLEIHLPLDVFVKQNGAPVFFGEIY